MRRWDLPPFLCLFLSPVTAGQLEITAPDPLEAVEGSPFETRIEAAGGTGAGHVWRVIQGMPPGLSLEWSNGCLEWGAFAAAGEVDESLPSPRLRAVSGMVASWRQPGILWVHDDLDSPVPCVYAIDESGRHRQTYILDADKVDWEDIALAPGSGGQERLYVGDFGDNSHSRPVAWLIRFDEPAVPAATVDPITIVPEVLYFKYPDGKRDIETLLFDWQSGTPYVIERNDAGCRAYKFPLPLDPDRTAADPVELILVTPSAILPPTLTGGDASRDGLRIVLRSYTHAFEYARQPGGAFDDLFFATPCILSDAGTQQYEAITYGPDGSTLFTTTELAGRSLAPILRSRAQPGTGTALIRGVPSTNGTWEVEIEAADSSGETVRRTLRIVVRTRGEPTAGAVPGDCDRSGHLDIADAICLLDLLFGTGVGESPCEEAGGEALLLDFNGDASEDISDALALLFHLFGERGGHVLGAECAQVAGCHGPCGGE
jgi:hypothetical protein